MDQLLPGFAHAPNLHPAVVHFPIAFWVAATGVWVIAGFASRDQSWRFGLWLHTLAVAAAALAVALGFWATEKMGHDSPGHDLVHNHRDLMLVATGLAVVVTALGWWRRDAGRRWRLGLTAGSLILLAVVTLGADRGAELVFRYGVGVAGEPPPHPDGHDHAHDDHEGSNAERPSPPSATSEGGMEPQRPQGTDEASPTTPSREGHHDHGDHEH